MLCLFLHAMCMCLLNYDAKVVDEIAESKRKSYEQN